ncbi:hypothetical protein BOO92_21265 [Vibrio navarrensis]|uniref:DUF645 family protein n=1 Tax=Vibrio navarrensis TaxID=29495 RepID=UPI0039B10CF2|nr:hypothetical protein [Vibrio navarrensis]
MFEFWLPTSHLLALGLCLLDALRKIAFKQMCLKNHFETISYKANKAFKRDLARVAFSICVGFSG